MSKKRRYSPKKYETFRERDSFCPMHWELVNSWAYLQLSDSAKVCLVFCKSLIRYQNSTGLPEGQFYFNRGIWKGFGWYKDPNKVLKDLRQLVQYGFVTVVRSGRNTRTKSIYKLSDAWQGLRSLEDMKLSGEDKAFLRMKGP